MSGDEAPPTHEGEALLYDYSKHLLSIALLGIGGIVTITQSPLGQRIRPELTAGLIAAFAAAGMFALQCTSVILRAREHGLPVPHAAWLCNRGATLFLGIGVGAFLAVWLEALLR